jgi:hypothetical protein
MPIPMLIALNLGAASLLTLVLTALMLLPKRLRPHRHTHPEAPRRANSGERRRPRAEGPHATRHVVVDH